MTSSELFSAMSVSASGMKAQSARIRVISENIANADTAASAPGENPYTRRNITFKSEMDKQLGAETVKVAHVGQDKKNPYRLKFMPDHPGADENGYVKVPNIDTLVEITDMREAQRSYEANLGMMDQSRTMMMQTIDLLRR